MKTTDYLALYAALLSTSVFLWNLLQARPRMRVDIIFTVETVDGETRSGLSVCVRNLSPHDIHLAHVGILYPYKKSTVGQRLAHMWRFRTLPRRLGWVHADMSSYAIESGCPLCLEGRKAHQVFIPWDKMEELLTDATARQLIGSAQDQLWSNAYSKPFECPAPRKDTAAG